MLNVRGLAVLFLLALTGCSVPVAESCEEMSGRQPLNADNRPEHWGAQRPFKPVWVAGQLRTVIQKPPYKVRVGRELEYCVPQVQSLLLIASNYTDPAAANYAFRWKIDVGQGGARMSVILDALNTQQVSVAGENIGVDVYCEAMDQTNVAQLYTPPDVTANFGVTIADGNVQSGQATYTQGFTVGNASQVDLVVPSMATSWRIDSSDGSVINALVAGVSVLVIGPSIGATYLGNKLDQYQSGFIPLPGNAQKLRIANVSGNTVQGLLVWGLDL